MPYQIYVGHSRDPKYQYRLTLYAPLKALLQVHQVYFPHEQDGPPSINSEELLPKCQLMIAEVSYPSTGLGLELAWARTAKILVLCIHLTDCPPSSSVTSLFPHLLAYADEADLCEKIAQWITAHTAELDGLLLSLPTASSVFREI